MAAILLEPAVMLLASSKAGLLFRRVTIPK